MYAYTDITTLSRKAEREQFIADLKAALIRHSIRPQLAIREGDRHTIFTLERRELSASIWLSHQRGGGTPIIAWYGAERPLAHVSDAWQSVNQFHRRKATGHPKELEGLICSLVAGLAAAMDGTAFVREDDQ